MQLSFILLFALSLSVSASTLAAVPTDQQNIAAAEKQYPKAGLDLHRRYVYSARGRSAGRFLIASLLLWRSELFPSP